MARALPLLLAAALSAFAGLRASAQADAVHLLECEALIDGLAAKRATEAVKALDAHALLSWHERFLKVRINGGVTTAQLLEALNTGERRYAPAGSPHRQAMPMRVDTGDPAGDDLRYQQAKAAWLNGQQSGAQPLNPDKP